MENLEKLVALGWVAYYVTLGRDPEVGHGLVCFIGSEWFYFGGCEAEGYDYVRDYLSFMDESEVLDDITSSLMGADPDGWKKRCIDYLEERLNDEGFDKWYYFQSYLEYGFTFDSDAHRIIVELAKWAEANLPKEKAIDLMTDKLGLSVPSEVWEAILES